VAEGDVVAVTQVNRLDAGSKVQVMQGGEGGKKGN
jgi:hypothetical protein